MTKLDQKFLSVNSSNLKEIYRKLILVSRYSFLTCQ